MKNRNLFGSLILLLTAFIWGIAFAFQRSGMDSIGPLTFMASRYVLAAVCLGILLIVMKGFKNAFRFSKETLKGGILCGLILTLASNFQQIGLVYTSAGKAGFITAMYILLVPLGNLIIFKKKPSGSSVVAVIIGAAGLFLLCVNEGFTVTTGDMWVFACALAFTCHIIATDRIVDRADPVQMSFIQFSVCMTVSWIFAFVLEEPSVSSIWEAGIAIGYCGIFSAGVGYTLQIVGQKYTEPATASLIMSFESVFGALSGAVLLGETMSARELAGCVIMFCAILVSELAGFVKPKN